MDCWVINWGGSSRDLGRLGWQSCLSVKPMSLSSKWGSSAVVLRGLMIAVLRGHGLVSVVTSQDIGCNEDLLLVWGVPLVSKGRCTKELVEFRGWGCHNDTRLCHNSRGQGLAKRVGRDLVL